MKTAFLNGVIEEEVYIEQPQGVVVEGRRTHVCKLKKALYSLKQVPRAWYGRIDSFLTSMGFSKNKTDPNLYFKVIEDEPVILLLYVDDLFLTGNEKQIVESKKKLIEEFEMKDLGLMHYFLGLEVWQKFRRNLSQPRKVCGRDIEETQYAEMQIHGHTHVLQPEAVS